jgi:uncharacterized protein YgbK (DUF1537 family)
MLPDGLLVAVYGDDFTGSAAVMEVLAFAGLPAALFLDLPDAAQLGRFPGLRGLIVAGTARASSPDWMDCHLPRLFDGLAATGAPLLHFKTCSTLDSAPHIGSIGRAIEIALSRRASPWVPILLAAPPIRRYQCFGHLFAGAPEGVFRLDRHPVMARHPVTPMDESDVARHLARQTAQPIGLIDLEALRTDPAARLARLNASGHRLITLDTLDDADLARAGALIWDSGATFCAGSQGVEYALVAHWQATGALPSAPPPPGLGPAPMVAVSGSVSPVTAAQIDHALELGFVPVPVDPADLIADSPAAEDSAVAACRAALAENRDPLVFTARGPDDPSVARLAAAREREGISATLANDRIGAALGRILARALRDTGTTRAVISGGDTSGHATRQLGVFALTALAPTIPGAAICRAWSDDPAVDGLQLALKGGQMGSQDYFAMVRAGGGQPPA